MTGPPTSRSVATHPEPDCAPRFHGGPLEDELRTLGIRAEALLDFSASTNPYGPHPTVLEALRTAAVQRYPDSTALAAREALGALEGWDADRVVLGNGAADLLWTLARTLLGSGRRVLIAEPTFSEFRAAAAASGAQVFEWRSREASGFALDVERIFASARDASANVIYLCSPNTPTGRAANAAELASMAAEHAAIHVVLDESFATLSEVHADAALPMPDNVVRVRSLTKDHGIPGVRVGYLLGRASLARAVEGNRPAWTTSAFAQAAAIACSRCAPFVAESRERLLSDRRALVTDLAALGVSAIPSRASFALFRVPRAAWLRTRLLEKHAILVRDCASFGLPGFLRLSAKPEAERRRLVRAWSEESPGC